MSSRWARAALAAVALLLATVALLAQVPRPVTGVFVAAPSPGTSCTVTAASASRASIAAAITAAPRGGIVCVPAGNSGSWTTDLTITKGVQLRGAGATGSSVTTLVSSVPFGDFNFIIDYFPDATAIANNEVFSISGFEFNGNNSSGCLFLHNETTDPTKPITQVRIHHNYFHDCRNNGNPARAMLTNGMTWGVIDHNTFLNNYKTSDFETSDAVGWAAAFTPGSATYMYFEDNTATNTIATGLSLVGDSGGQGGRYVARYNTLNSVAQTDNSQTYDIHGDLSDTGTVGAEIYHNVLTTRAGSGQFVDTRGGTDKIFANRVIGSTSSAAEVRNEQTPGFDDVKNTHFWGNTFGPTTGLENPMPTNCTQGCTDIPQNTAWFADSSGDTLPATCTTNTYYALSTTDAIYKCTSTNNYTVFYQPYTYPHPLTTSGALSGGGPQFFVSTTGNDANAGTQAAPWRTIAKANTTLVAGDTVNIAAGTYVDRIAPSNTGLTEGRRITYQTYNGRVTISNRADGIVLTTKNYVSVLGAFTFSNLDTFLIIQTASNHNVIDGLSTDNMVFGPMRSQGDWAGSRIWQNSHYNVVRNASFHDYGACTGIPYPDPSGSDDGSNFDVGNENVSTDGTDRNLIELNTFYHGGHHGFGMNANHNVVRNNYFHNEAWTQGRGNRTAYNAGTGSASDRNVFEGNHYGYSAQPCDSYGVTNVLFASADNIIRRNSTYHANHSGFALGSYSSNTTDRNHIYHNTIFNTGLSTDGGTSPSERSSIYFAGYASSTSGTQVKNNLFFHNTQHAGQAACPSCGLNTATLGAQTFANNFDGDTQGDPLFTSASLTPPDPFMPSVPDFHLQAGSPAVDQGGALTTITSGTGSGTRIVVADAGYFTDGWGIPNTTGDTIQLSGTATTATIVSIDYATNTIYLNTSVSWTAGQGIMLPYNGSAPDPGAYER